MEIAVVGLNHKTASVDIRERLSFEAEPAGEALKQIKSRFSDVEFVLLSTCNRVEFYCAFEDGSEFGTEDLVQFIGEFRQIDIEDFRSLLYIKRNEDAVRHLLTVGSSLDSMVVGEPQIVSQVKDSYKLANSVGATGKVLNHLFHSAFSATKQIYTDTSIASRRVSVAGVAVELAGQLFEDISSAKVVVVGAGDMGELLVEHFLHIGCSDITIVNRSEARARNLAAKHEVRADKWDQLDEHFLKANIVVAAATAADGYLFEKKTFAKRIAKRKSRNLLIVDIAVPRNFDPAVNDIEDIYLYSVDDLAQVVQDNIKLRQDDLEQAIEIICAKVAEFMDWLGSMDIGPIIGRIKQNFERIRQDEVEKFFTGDRQEASCQDAMSATVSRVVNKLLHCVIKNISVVAKEHNPAEAAKLAGNIAEHAEEIIDKDNSKQEDRIN